jgi:hypothetical protein
MMEVITTGMRRSIGALFETAGVLLKLMWCDFKIAKHWACADGAA